MNFQDFTICSVRKRVPDFMVGSLMHERKYVQFSTSV